MGIIRPLDEHLANQIAAGEVVERPASVLKELIENAVDAGSTRVDVSAEEGGLNLLRVADDGSGIQPDDMLLAFQRHATSKISSGKDLFQIATLGFRGEALPSIAAVAKVKCVSATDDSGLGRLLEIEGGNMLANRDTNAPKGTEMVVKDLFYNTPARLKYMKTIQTELGHLSDVVYRQALARPDIAFTFSHNGNLLLRTPGNGDLRQVVAAIYGTASAKAMIAVNEESPDYTLIGLTAMPTETRANRNAVTVLVNGRYVRSQAVAQPLLQAYHTLLPLHRYPLTVLDLKMHPTLVDVNVHPAKLEVRFSKENELRAFVESAIKKALSTEAYIPSGAAVRAPKTNTWVQDQIRFQVPAVEPSLKPVSSELAAASELEAMESLIAETKAGYASPSFFPSNQSDNYAALNDPIERTANPSKPYNGSKDSYSSNKPGTSYGSDNSGGSPWAEKPVVEKVPEQIWKSAFAVPDVQPRVPEFPELSWIGQLHGTYIVAQNVNGLYLIDQHAAHERIHYEFYYDKFGRPEEASQELLLPVTLEFAPDECAVLRGRLAAFESAGVYMEDFGGNTFIIRAVPHWFPGGDEAAVVREMAEWIIQERSVDLHALREKAAIMCSCKASIKANQALTRESGEKLLQRLAACRQPYTCPHGRPIVVSFSTYELEKMFKRVTS
ncbi:DNA mismatch repair endonuclease MutL [Cohnella herbarum]|uniref:DNA mismatch repair protein MutL n=1 Tax=Cohnella herbarum TaxID=2728023 RepID=A0A7Z2VGI6_9BACL|nr:DNA mismatch repair endonuclease MutL [Cohnella herbarum]QJD82525.1 DNA mismatch repair endonuclease MutL [Cohnella herbarum]